MENINVKINKKTRLVNLSKSVIGNDGENLQEKLVFSFDEFVDGTARLELNRNNTKSYIMLAKVNNTYELPIKSIITKVGKLDMQLVITEGINDNEIPIFKSNTFYVVVNSSINAVEEEPEGYAQWIDIANAKINLINEKLDDIDEAITETNNLDLDVSKSGKIATVTLTKKDTTTKTVTLSDGTSLMFNWDGTRLGIKTDEETEYTYVDLQGIQGPIGPKGEAFTIKKTYTSVAEMNADFNNMQLGDYVMIASTVEVEDNAKLYTRGENEWIFISDFSGAQGIRGETGLTPNIQIGAVVTGQTSSVTRTGTNENPILNFVLEKGETGATGETGPTGATGNGIATIQKTSSEGLIDTYTITYTNGNTTTFQITNGEDGEVTQTQFDELQEEVDDLRRNQKQDTTSGTNIYVDDAFDTRIMESKMSKESTQDGTPTPENPVEVKTVKGYRNLFDKDSVINAYLNNDGTTTSNSLFRVSDFIELNKGKNYITIVGNAGRTEINCFYDEQKNFISNFNMSTNSSKTVEIPSNAYYVRTTVYRGNLDSYQLTEGTEELPFVPYGTNYVYTKVSNGTDTNYYTIPLNNNEIAGIGNYKDELIVDKNGHCWLNKKTGKLVLNGSENYERSNRIDNWTQYRLLRNLNTSTNANLLSNYFISYNYNYVFSNKLNGITIDTINRLRLSFSETEWTTVNELKTWLSEHNTEVYYPLETPEPIDLEYDVDVRLFNGVNNISNSDDMDMTITYVQDINMIIDKLINELGGNE